MHLLCTPSPACDGVLGSFTKWRRCSSGQIRAQTKTGGIAWQSVHTQGRKIAVPIGGLIFSEFTAGQHLGDMAGGLESCTVPRGCGQ